MHISILYYTILIYIVYYTILYFIHPYIGGEKAFIKNMIEESSLFPSNVGWYTTLVSKVEHLDELIDVLRGQGTLQEYKVSANICIYVN